MILKLTRHLMSKMSVLHVAEKNSIAKQVSNILSRSNKHTIPSLSKYNPIFQFKIQQKPHHFTSVRGHVFDYELPQECKNWKTYDNKKILSRQVPMIRKLGFSMDDVARNLQKLARQHNQLILWLDCDREGQAIAYQVIQICTRINPRLLIKRARFSAVTAVDVWNAYNGLVNPNKLEADAVNYRIEIDFRTGCAFTRYQTTVFQKYFQMQSGSFISYGPCQMPTLSFVVQRYLQIKNFKPQKYWVIQMTCIIDENTGIPFTWQRKSTKNQIQANQLMVKIINSFPDGKVVGNVKERKASQKKKYRPYPLTTVNFQKLATDKLKLSSGKAMQIAQKLYQNGLISYPRTQTNAFPKTMNLKNLIQRLEQSNQFGTYVKKLLQEDKYKPPKAGNSNDQAHTPIHPVKMVQKSQLSNEEWRVYDLIVRSFLACCSADAIGEQFMVKAQINGQKFKASYLTIKQLNYLQIYPFEKWVQTSFPANIPDNFPAIINLKQSKTTPPGYLTQSELISLMQKNQIGTDSTIHEHIQTIQKRQYAIKTNNTFKPTNLGASLVQTYKQLQIALPQCQIRRKIQQKMNRIAEGQIEKQMATRETLHQMIPIYDRLAQIKQQWLNTIKKYMESNSQLKQITVQERNQQQGQHNQNRRTLIVACKCKKCSQNAVVRYSQKNNSYLLGCSKFPNCRWAQSLPPYIGDVKQTGKQCPKCQTGMIVNIKAKQGKIIQPLMMRIRFEQSQDGYVQVCMNPDCDKDFYQFIDEYQGFNQNTNNNSMPHSNQTRNYNNNNNSSSNNRSFKNNQNSYNKNKNNSNSQYKNKSRDNNKTDYHSFTNTMPNSGNQYKKEVICYICRQVGHIAPQCPQKGQKYQPKSTTNTITNTFKNKNKMINLYSDFNSQVEQQTKTKKKCNQCGIEGRHPKGSNCPSVVRKRKPKQQ